MCRPNGAQNDLDGRPVRECDATAELGLDNLLRKGAHGRVVVLQKAEHEAAEDLLLRFWKGTDELAKGSDRRLAGLDGL